MAGDLLGSVSALAHRLRAAHTIRNLTAARHDQGVKRIRPTGATKGAEAKEGNLLVRFVVVRARALKRGSWTHGLGDIRVGRSARRICAEVGGGGSPRVVSGRERRFGLPHPILQQLAKVGSRQDRVEGRTAEWWSSEQGVRRCSESHCIAERPEKYGVGQLLKLASMHRRKALWPQ